MSVESLAVALHHSRATGTAKLILIGIANHDGDGGAWPSVGTLAKYAAVHPRNVQKGIRRLQELGEINVRLQAGGLLGMDDTSRPNHYTITLRCPVWCDGSTQHRDTRRPAAPGLWKNPLTDAPPPGGSATPPLAVAPPPPLAVAPPEPSYEPPSNSTGSDTDSSTVGEPLCSECLMRADQCRLRGPEIQGHHYSPKGVTP